ncbi:hypothetical protein YPPY25_4584, partial [Yersinia pestis PY-25]
MPRPETKHHNA